MTQRSLFRTLVFTSLLGLMLALPHYASAQEAKPAPADTQEVVKETSDAAHKSKAANAEAISEDAAPAAQEADVDASTAAEEADVAAPTPEEMDAITAYDPAKVRGIAKPWQVYYQKPASPVMKHLEWLHNYIMWFIVIITLVVTALLVYVCIRFRASKQAVPHRFAHNTMVEIAWTLIPILILVAIAIPSVRAHFQYTNNENIINNPDMTLKVTGHQWYWSYEYPEHGIAYDSNIVPEKDLNEGEPRLLMVDNPVVVPVNKVVRVQLTSADVIHNFAMPSMGLKQDAVPGKLNETWFKATKEGIYFGQCSELCGKYHGYMPIMFVVVSDEDFARWVAGAKVKFAARTGLQFAALN